MLVTPYCKRTRPGRGTNTKAAGFPPLSRRSPATFLPPFALGLAPTHLGWGTRRHSLVGPGPPGLETPTGSLHLLAPLLLTGGKGADLVIRGNVVLNTLSARSTSTLLRDQICINSSSRRHVLGLAELSYATAFDSPSMQSSGMFS
jgi:hypothetical protein